MKVSIEKQIATSSLFLVVLVATSSIVSATEGNTDNNIELGFNSDEHSSGSNQQQPAQAKPELHKERQQEHPDQSQQNQDEQEQHEQNRQPKRKPSSYIPSMPASESEDLEDSEFDPLRSFLQQSFMRQFEPIRIPSFIPPIPPMPSMINQESMMRKFEKEASEGVSETRFERNGVGYIKTCTVRRVERNRSPSTELLKKNSANFRK